MTLPNGSNNAPTSFGGNRGSAPNPAASGPATVPMPGSDVQDDFFSSIDFDSVEEGFSEIPPEQFGWYEAIIQDVTKSASKAGNPQLEINFQFAANQALSGRRMKYWLVKTSKTEWKIKQFLSNVGVPEHHYRSVNPYRDLNNLYLQVKVGTDDFNDRVKILDFRPSQWQEQQKARLAG